MPQLEFHTWASQIFWLVVCFGLLYAFMAIKVVPSLGGIVAKRKSQTQGHKDRAVALKEEAHAILERCSMSRKDAHAQAQKVLAQAKEALNKEVDARLKACEREIQGIKEKENKALDKIRAGLQKESTAMAETLSQSMLKQLGFKG